jgi:hypothetical protein
MNKTESENTLDNDVIKIRLSEFPETLRHNKIYKLLRQEYFKLDPLIPILREIYERETILSNIIDMSYIINQLKQISPSSISTNINYDLVLKNKHAIKPYISYLLTISNDVRFNKKSETLSEYIYDISLLLTTPREKLLKKIIKNNRKTLLDYCIEKNIIEKDDNIISELLTRYDNIELFEIYYYLNNEILSNERFENMAIICIQNGSIKCLEFLYETKKMHWKWTVEMFNETIKKTQLESLKFIFEKTLDKCPFNELSFAYACEIGDINIVEYLYEHKCPVDYISTLYAAKGNNLQILKYLYNKGIPLYYDICLYATINNNLDMLIFAHENGCSIELKNLPCKLCYYAVLNNNIDMFKYLINNNASYNKDDLYKIIVKKNNIDNSEFIQFMNSFE